MWTRTAITLLLGIDYPIIQGPFGGGLSSVDLVSAVSNAGGIGIFGVNAASSKEIVQIAADIRKRTEKPFGLNLWVSDGVQPAEKPEEFESVFAWFDGYWQELGINRPALPGRFVQDFGTQVEALLEAGPRVASFVFGLPSREVVNACRARNIFVIATATNVDEALHLEEGGVDAIVATGFEAGGHRPSFLMRAEGSLVGSLALVPQVADRVKVPVIAAGGIADGRGIAAALSLGAEAVQIGTAFLACKQSGASPVHREMLFRIKAVDTRLTRAFSGRLLRAIRNRLMDAAEAHSAQPLPYPFQNWLTGTLRKSAAGQGRGDLLSLQAGQIAPLLKHEDAAALVSELVLQATGTIGKLSGKS